MNDALVVLGMHRSGTSSVAGTLALLGATAPLTLMPDHPDNPKGYWESEVLTALSDEILTSGGSAWSDWRPFSSTWVRSKAGKGFSKSIVAALKAEFNDAPLIVLKDPRMCRIFPVWSMGLKAAGYEPLVMIPLRAPVEVAASLSARDGFSQAHGLLIWLRNVLEAEAASRGFRRHFFLWSDFIRDWRKELDRATDALGVTLPGRSDFGDARVDAFLDGKLRRQVARDGLPSNSPEWVARTEDALAALLSDANDVRAQTALDGLRDDFDATARLLGPAFVGIESEHAAKQAGLRSQIELLTASLAEASGQRDHLAIERTETTAALAAAHAEIARTRAQVDTVTTEADGLRVELTDACKQIELLRDQLVDACGQRDHLAVERTQTADALAAARSEVDESKAGVEVLTARIKELDAELAGARAAVVEMSGSVDKLTKERDHAANQAVAAGDELKAVHAAGVEREAVLQREIDTLQTTRAAQRIEVERLEIERSDLQDRVRQMETEVAVATERLQQAAAEMSNFLTEQRARPLRSAMTVLTHALKARRAETSEISKSSS